MAAELDAWDPSLSLSPSSGRRGGGRGGGNRRRGRARIGRGGEEGRGEGEEQEEGVRYYTVLGVRHRGEEALERRVRSLFWLSYRHSFKRMHPYRLTSDTGWGCMLRSVQMLAAQTLATLVWGPDWRLPKRTETKRGDENYCQILRSCSDYPGLRCVFSLHNMVQCGQRYGLLPGQWFGPRTAVLVLRDLVHVSRVKCGGFLEAVVSDGDMVYLEDLDYTMCAALREDEAAEATAEQEEQTAVKDGTEDGGGFRDALQGPSPGTIVSTAAATVGNAGNGDGEAANNANGDDDDDDDDNEDDDDQFLDAASSPSIPPRPAKRKPGIAPVKLDKASVSDDPLLHPRDSESEDADKDSGGGGGGGGGALAASAGGSRPSAGSAASAASSQSQSLHDANLIEWDCSLLLLIPLRIGLRNFDAKYIPAVKRLLDLRWSVGFVGGRPNHAVYYFGYERGTNTLLCLDPHTTQASPEHIPDPRPTESHVSSVHCSSPWTMAARNLDPCLAFGFLFASREEFILFRSELDAIRSDPTNPIPLPFSIEDAAPDFSAFGQTLGSGGAGEDLDDFDADADDSLLGGGAGAGAGAMQAVRAPSGGRGGNLAVDDDEEEDEYVFV